MLVNISLRTLIRTYVYFLSILTTVCTLEPYYNITQKNVSRQREVNEQIVDCNEIYRPN